MENESTKVGHTKYIKNGLGKRYIRRTSVVGLLGVPPAPQ